MSTPKVKQLEPGTAGQVLKTDSSITPVWRSGQSGLFLFGANGINTTTLIRYLYPGYAFSIASANEIPMIAQRSGILLNMRLVIRDNTPGNGNAVVITTRHNLADTPLAITFNTAGGAYDIFSDLTNSVTITAGDLVSVMVTKSLSIGTSPNNLVLTYEFS